jgi:hypothetical protein
MDQQAQNGTVQQDGGRADDHESDRVIAKEASLPLAQG